MEVAATDGNPDWSMEHGQDALHSHVPATNPLPADCNGFPRLSPASVINTQTSPQTSLLHERNSIPESLVQSECVSVNRNPTPKQREGFLKSFEHASCFGQGLKANLLVTEQML